jgi:lipopolysaccharide export system protein LptA
VRGFAPALLLGLLLPLAVHAQPIDMNKGGPVEVTSDNGMEWRQNEQTILARGNAKAVRGDVTVTADTLIAHYRKKAPVAGAAPTPAPAATPAGGPADPSGDTGNNEIYRLEADGHVHIFTATDQAFGDHAIYDIDQAVLVLTGPDLHIITPQQVMSARDVMEYWSQKHMAVGRGNAVVTTNDGRRLSADTLVGYTEDPNAPAQPGAPPVKTVAAKPDKTGADPLGAGGKLKRVDAFGHVEVRTATEIIKADKGVYVPDTGIARLAGNVHLTRGQNQLNGDYGVTNLKTGVSTVSRDPGNRVQGLVVPNDKTVPTGGSTPPKPAAQPHPAAQPQKELSN